MVVFENRLKLTSGDARRPLHTLHMLAAVVCLHHPDSVLPTATVRPDRTALNHPATAVETEKKFFTFTATDSTFSRACKVAVLLDDPLALETRCVQRLVPQHGHHRVSSPVAGQLEVQGTFTVP